MADLESFMAAAAEFRRLIVDTKVTLMFEAFHLRRLCTLKKGLHQRVSGFINE